MLRRAGRRLQGQVPARGDHAGRTGGPEDGYVSRCRQLAAAALWRAVQLWVFGLLQLVCGSWYDEYACT